MRQNALLTWFLLTVGLSVPYGIIDSEDSKVIQYKIDVELTWFHKIRTERAVESSHDLETSIAMFVLIGLRVELFEWGKLAQIVKMFFLLFT